MGLLPASSRSNNKITVSTMSSRYPITVKTTVHPITTKHLLPISVCLVLFYYTIKYIIMQ